MRKFHVTLEVTIKDDYVHPNDIVWATSISSVSDIQCKFLETIEVYTLSDKES